MMQSDHYIDKQAIGKSTYQSTSMLLNFEFE